MLQVIKDPYKDRYIIIGNRSESYPERNGLNYTKSEAECIMRKICLLSAAEELEKERYENTDEYLSNFAGRPIRIFGSSSEIYKDDVDALKKIAAALENHCYDRTVGEQKRIEELRRGVREGEALGTLADSFAMHKKKTLSNRL